MKLLVSLLAGTVAVLTQSSAPAKALADQFQQKLQQIVEHDGKSQRRTSVLQSEVNSYLHVKGPELLPVGVTDATLAAEGGGRVSGRATVDLDVLREKKSSGSWFDITSYLTGKLPVAATGVLHTKEGTARFDLQTATVSGVPVPKGFLQELVSYYTRSPGHPKGISLDDVFEMPANIREIQVGQGSAIVVQ
jgi:hypothetical protein